jgi:hypothetical protein
MMSSGMANGIPNPNGIKYRIIIIVANDINIVDTICIIAPKLAINV